MEHVEKAYGQIDGRFINSAGEIKRRLSSIKAFVFDWDGVFNNGEKSTSAGSLFSEVDSMGVNLLRFSYFLKNGHLPVSLIISGESNDTAFYYSKREGFTYCFYKVAHKLRALEFLCEKEKIQPSEVAYFFDDVLDIPIAEMCGLRMQVNQGINPLFINYCIDNNLVDYLTSSAGGAFAVREATELLIGLNGNYNEVIQARITNSQAYQHYIGLRRQVVPQFYTLKENAIEAAEPAR
jgi:3-deoxy-D-manno-octulosonate 8-phosphate phosphatase (KDO 8-P phosphatase)